MAVSKDTKILAYLNTLPKEKLIELLMQYAPESFKKEIILRDAPDDVLDIRLNAIISSINTSLDDEELLHHPPKFQKEISQYMEDLKAFVNKNPNRIMQIVFDLALEIEEKQENGYLWIDHYYEEEYFDFDIFSDEIMVLIDKIEDIKLQIKLFVEFGELAQKSAYLAFSFEALKIEDKKLLLTHFNEKSSLAFYYCIEALLSFEEKENFLLSAGSNESLISFYIENDKEKLAIEIIENLLKEKFDLSYVEKLLTLTSVSKERLRLFVSQTIESSYGGFNFIVDGFKKLDDIKELELLWKEKSLSQYYSYLAKEKRIDEMYILLEALPNNREAFLKKHKLAYREEAIDFFNAQIKENLKNTGDNYYHNIADTLWEFKGLIEEEELKARVESLKFEYKRRRNFVGILVTRFG